MGADIWAYENPDGATECGDDGGSLVQQRHVALGQCIPARDLRHDIENEDLHLMLSTHYEGGLFLIADVYNDSGCAGYHEGRSGPPLQYGTVACDHHTKICLPQLGNTWFGCSYKPNPFKSSASEFAI